MSRVLSFREMVEHEGRKPTPRQAFLDEIARMTGVSSNTVKQWAAGTQGPNPTAMMILSAHFGAEPGELFPGGDRGGGVA